LTNGRLGKKVTVEQRQGVDGTSITMTSPRQTFRRDTAVGDGWTESTGSYSKRNRVFGRDLRERQRDKVTTDASGVVRRTESLRRDGSVKKVVTERVMADGRSRKTTTRLRKDGTARSVKEKETIEHPSGKRAKRDVRSVRRSVRRDGTTRFGVGRARVNGKRSAFAETPVGTLGTPRGRITSSAPQRRPSGDDREPQARGRRRGRAGAASSRGGGRRRRAPRAPSRHQVAVPAGEPAQDVERAEDADDRAVLAHHRDAVHALERHERRRLRHRRVLRQREGKRHHDLADRGAGDRL